MEVSGQILAPAARFTPRKDLVPTSMGLGVPQSRSGRLENR